MCIPVAAGSILSIWIPAGGKHSFDVLLSERVIPGAHVKQAPCYLCLGESSPHLPSLCLTPSMRATERRLQIYSQGRMEKGFFCRHRKTLLFGKGLSKWQKDAQEPWTHHDLAGGCPLPFRAASVPWEAPATHWPLELLYLLLCLSGRVLSSLPLVFMFLLRHLFSQEPSSDADRCIVTTLSSPGTGFIAWWSHVPCASASLCSAVAWVSLLLSCPGTYHRSCHLDVTPKGFLEGESILHIKLITLTCLCGDHGYETRMVICQLSRDLYAFLSSFFEGPLR